MFIELSEFLRCPAEHSESHCVVASDLMEGREVVRGTVGCPVCRREYRITNRIIHFGNPPEGRPTAPPPGGDALQALLGITTSGGYLVLVGSAATRSREVSELAPGVHMVGINAPLSVRAGGGISLLRAAASIPLRTAMARGVVLGEEVTSGPWLAEAARVLLPGLRLVAVAGQMDIAGVAMLAAERGLWVGQRIRDPK